MKEPAGYLNFFLIAILYQNKIFDFMRITLISSEGLVEFLMAVDQHW
jgi:hypothetical protein